MTSLSKQWHGPLPPLLTVFLLLSSSAAASTSSSTVDPERVAQARQVCVDRWNHTNMRWSRSASAIVKSGPCRVTIAYYSSYEGKEDRSLGFECRLNTYGAYTCPYRADVGAGVSNPGAKGPNLVGWNARLRQSGRLVLDRAPRNPRRTSPPWWAVRYPVIGGLIVPFDHAGRLRSGLKLTGPARRDICRAQPLWATANGPLECGETSADRILCFPPRRPARVGDILACPRREGSRSFTRLALTGLT